MQRKKERTKELKRWNGESKKFKIMVERKNEKEKKQMDRKEGKKGEGTKKNQKKRRKNEKKKQEIYIFF